MELDPGLDGGAHVVGVRRARRQHGAHRAAPGDRAPGPLRFVDDQWGSPTFTADLAGVVAVLGTERLPGTFHVTNAGVTSWYGFARAVLAVAGHDPDRVEPIATAELDPPRPAPRPANSALDNAAMRLMGMELTAATGATPWSVWWARSSRSRRRPRRHGDPAEHGTARGDHGGDRGRLRRSHHRRRPHPPRLSGGVRGVEPSQGAAAVAGRAHHRGGGPRRHPHRRARLGTAHVRARGHRGGAAAPTSCSCASPPPRAPTGPPT